MNTIELIDAVKARHGIKSDYALAAFLGTSRAVISNYRRGHHSMDEAIALRVAEALDLDAGAVLAWVYAERTKCPAAAEALRSLAGRFLGAFAPVILGVSLNLGVPTPAAAATSAILPPYTLRASRRRRFSDMARSLLGANHAQRSLTLTPH